MLRGFALGLLIGPLLLVGIACAWAFPGWALTIALIPLVLALLYGVGKSRQFLPGSTEASRTDPAETLRAAYRIDDGIHIDWVQHRRRPPRR